MHFDPSPHPLPSSPWWILLKRGGGGGGKPIQFPLKVPQPPSDEQNKIIIMLVRGGCEAFVVVDVVAQQGFFLFIQTLYSHE